MTPDEITPDEITPDDPFDLERFVVAQDTGDVFAHAIEELRRGRKTTHWMWFVFPQMAGLGHSALSTRFAISSLDEARAYVGHPVLGPRLIECAETVANLSGLSAQQIFGSVDAQKLHSSMTLFMRAAPDERAVARVLEQYFGGRPDAATDRLLSSPASSPASPASSARRTVGPGTPSR